MDTPNSHHRQPEDAPIDDDESHHDTESNASWDSEPPNKSDSEHEATKAQNLILLQAVAAGDEEILQSALDEGANLVARDADGQTSLHLAILHDHESMVRMLLKKGADIEATTKNGAKPLYNAAEMGNLRLVDLLLQFRADVESPNTIGKTTALYQAVSKEHLEVARFLLDHKADIDVKDPNGYTPLFIAVSQGHLDLVEMLLQYGASKKTRLPDGRNVEDLASGDSEMRDRLLLDLLQDDQVLQGPPIASPNPASERPYAYTRPPPVDRPDKLNACHGFKCTIVDFFLGDREQRIQVSPTVYEVLYGKGPSAIMEAARGTKMPGRDRAFRWYHFPANNALVTLILAERSSGSSMFDEILKSDLGLTSAADRQFCASTAHSSFMRPLCQSVKPHPKSSLGKCQRDPIMAFIPFLHFETYSGYAGMSQVVQEVKIRIFQEHAALNPGWVLPAPRRGRKKSKKKEAPPVVTVSLARKSDAQKGFRDTLHDAKILKTTFRSFTSKLTNLT